MSKEYIKPIPKIQPWSEKFWEGTKQGKLLIQHCKNCNSLIFYPKKACPECWSENLDWTQASGKAKVTTFTVVKDMVEPRFWADIPYVLALVELEEGLQMMTRIVECDHDNLKIGMDVEVVFEDITDKCALPYFRPVL